jgi:hypothetical protein
MPFKEIFKMKKNVSRLFLVLIAIAGLLASPVFADLGLQQIVNSQGDVAPLAVGQAVRVEAEAIFASNTDPAVIQQKLIAILNEAAATGNEAAVRYAIVAVMAAGGVDNLNASKTAINNSDVFNKYESLTAVTVAATEALLTASGGAAEVVGLMQQGGGGEDQRTLGGGNPPEAPLGADVNDNDLPATGI